LVVGKRVAAGTWVAVGTFQWVVVVVRSPVPKNRRLSKVSITIEEEYHIDRRVFAYQLIRQFAAVIAQYHQLKHHTPALCP
jgi:hypothetical protein